jgi:hypothetical protein
MSPAFARSRRWHVWQAGKGTPHFVPDLPDLSRLARHFQTCRTFPDLKPTKKLLRLIERAVEEKGLRFVHDEHDTRLEYDVLNFTAFCAAQDTG